MRISWPLILVKYVVARISSTGGEWTKEVLSPRRAQGPESLPDRDRRTRTSSIGLTPSNSGSIWTFASGSYLGNTRSDRALVKTAPIRGEEVWIVVGVYIFVAVLRFVNRDKGDKNMRATEVSLCLTCVNSVVTRGTCDEEWVACNYGGAMRAVKFTVRSCSGFSGVLLRVVGSQV